MAATSAAVVDG
jgi:hypothetical protein